jgi:hypothetical protein
MLSFQQLCVHWQQHAPACDTLSLCKESLKDRRSQKNSHKSHMVLIKIDIITSKAKSLRRKLANTNCVHVAFVVQLVVRTSRLGYSKRD